MRAHFFCAFLMDMNLQKRCFISYIKKYLVYKKKKLSQIKCAFSDVECPFKDVECPFDVFEPPFNDAERRFLLDARTFSIRKYVNTNQE